MFVSLVLNHIAFSLPNYSCPIEKAILFSIFSGLTVTALQLHAISLPASPSACLVREGALAKGTGSMLQG